MIDRMGWEGISALIAAGAAVITLIVGWLQLRGALRAADKSYRAALDAVKATAAETHTQWLRGVRREAYAAFLLECSKTEVVISRLVDDIGHNEIPVDQREQRRETVKAAVKELHNRALIVDLEGPPELGRLAEAIACNGNEQLHKTLDFCNLHWAWEDLTRTAEGPDRQQVSGFYQALHHLMAVRPARVTSPDDEGATSDFRHAYERMEQAERELSFTLQHSRLIIGARRYALGASEAFVAMAISGGRSYEMLKDEFRDRVREVLNTSR
ncbi:hypothetical protein ACFY83_32495 [Streptomyces althioticus]|uniref:hypothetical protein n=1 Tax=Streptomyces althioticus TaxID=83380 RepID=UPI0036E70478